MAERARAERHFADALDAFAASQARFEVGRARLALSELLCTGDEQ